MYGFLRFLSGFTDWVWGFVCLPLSLFSSAYVIVFMYLFIHTQSLKKYYVLGPVLDHGDLWQMNHSPAAGALRVWWEWEQKLGQTTVSLVKARSNEQDSLQSVDRGETQGQERLQRGRVIWAGFFRMNRSLSGENLGEIIPGAVGLPSSLGLPQQGRQAGGVVLDKTGRECRVTARRALYNMSNGFTTHMISFLPSFSPSPMSFLIMENWNAEYLIFQVSPPWGPGVPCRRQGFQCQTLVGSEVTRLDPSKGNGLRDSICEV